MGLTHINRELQLALSKPLEIAADPFFIIRGPKFFRSVTIPDRNGNIAFVELDQALNDGEKELTIEEMVGLLREYMGRFGYVINSYKLIDPKSP